MTFRLFHLLFFPSQANDKLIETILINPFSEGRNSYKKHRDSTRLKKKINLSDQNQFKMICAILLVSTSDWKISNSNLYAINEQRTSIVILNRIPMISHTNRNEYLSSINITSQTPFFNAPLAQINVPPSVLSRTLFGNWSRNFSLHSVADMMVKSTLFNWFDIILLGLSSSIRYGSVKPQPTASAVCPE